MFSRIRSTLTAAAVSGALLLAAPMASADVYPAPIPPGGPGTVSGELVPGGTVALAFLPSMFAGNEPVSLRLTGENASGATLATLFRMAVETATLGTVTSAADGSLDVKIVLPANASGSYDLTGVSPSRPEGVTLTVALPASGGGAGGGSGADGGAGGGVPGDGSSGGGALPDTGANGAVLRTALIGGGVLVLVGAGVVVVTSERRRREQATAAVS